MEAKISDHELTFLVLRFIIQKLIKGCFMGESKIYSHEIPTVLGF